MKRFICTILISCVLILGGVPAYADLTGHTKEDVDLIFIWLDPDYDGDPSDSAWYTALDAKIGTGDVGTASTLDYESTMTNGNDLPQGSAIWTHGDTYWLSTVTAGANPTAASGSIFHDTTADQFLYGTTGIIHPVTSVPVVIERLSSDDDSYEIYMATYPQTIERIGVHCEGTCTTPATLTFSDRAGNLLTVGAITVSTGTGNTSMATVSNGGSLVEGEGLLINVTNTPTPDATDKYIIALETRAVRQ